MSETVRLTIAVNKALQSLEGAGLAGLMGLLLPLLQHAVHMGLLNGGQLLTAQREHWHEHCDEGIFNCLFLGDRLFLK